MTNQKRSEEMSDGRGKKRERLSLLLIGTILPICLASLTTLAQIASDEPKTYKFQNGRWFDGRGFKRQTFYSVNGILTKRQPAKIDRSIDLNNGFVIPPFADAHTHNLDGKANLDKLANLYLTEGTFYVQVLGNYSSGAKQARSFVNKPGTIDVSYANGMLTNTYGHPFLVYEPYALGIYNYADIKPRIEEIKKSRRGENDVYWFLDSRADVDAKWPTILATKPDLIKIGLLDAGNQAKAIAAGDIVGKGLSPEVAEYVVQKAHAAGFRVYAHIETADDFRLGVKIGVDGFAHAPNYNWDGKLETKPPNDISVEDIKLAAKQRVVVIPTAARGVFRQTDYDPSGKGTLNKERFARVIDRYRGLYKLMHRNGVRIALGLDSYGTTLMPEIWYFHENKIFDDLTLLKIAVETTPQTIFPNRKIGHLRQDYEASFLVLKGNPLEDFSQIKLIERRFKQGVMIDHQ